MHILATQTEEQAVYSGHLWAAYYPIYSILHPAIRSLRSSAAWFLLCFGGRMAFDLHLSWARKGVVAMRQDSNY